MKPTMIQISIKNDFHQFLINKPIEIVLLASVYTCISLKRIN